MCGCGGSPRATSAPRQDQSGSAQRNDPTAVRNDPGGYVWQPPAQPDTAAPADPVPANA